VRNGVYGDSALETTLNNVPVSVVILDENKCVRYVNEPALSNLHKKPSEVLQQHLRVDLRCRYDKDKACGRSVVFGSRKFKKTISDAMYTGQATDYKIKHKCFASDRMGNECQFHVNVAPMILIEKFNVIITL